MFAKTLKIELGDINSYTYKTHSLLVFKPTGCLFISISHLVDFFLLSLVHLICLLFYTLKRKVLQKVLQCQPFGSIKNL